MIRGRNRYCWSTTNTMKKLSTQLTQQWMTQRLEAPTLPRRFVRSNIDNILPRSPALASADDEGEPPGKKGNIAATARRKRRECQK